MLMDKVILGRMNNQSKDTKVGKHGAHIGKGGEATLCTWTWCVCARARVCVCARACSVMPNSLQPQDYSLPGSSLHGIFQARILEQVAISFSGDLPDPGIEPTSPASPALAGRFFTT